MPRESLSKNDHYQDMRISLKTQSNLAVMPVLRGFA